MTTCRSGADQTGQKHPPRQAASAHGNDKIGHDVFHQGTWNLATVIRKMLQLWNIMLRRSQYVMSSSSICVLVQLLLQHLRVQLQSNPAGLLPNLIIPSLY
jgi:hypothetical protein